jgi:hypothetical protein
MTKSNQRPTPPSGHSSRFPILCFTTVNSSRQAAIHLSAQRRFKKSLAMLAAALTIPCLTSLDLRAATVADWKFNAANPTADSSGNGNTLTLNGNITFSSDFATNAPGSTNSAVFDGASYAQTVANLNFTPYNQLTIEFFAKYSSGSPLQMFFSQNNLNNVNGAFYLDTGEAGPTELKAAQSTALGWETDQAPEPTDGAWHHYALTMDESGAIPVFRIYVDGYEADTGGLASAAVPGFNNDIFTIGAYPPTYDFNYAGMMGEMRVSSGILTPAQFLIGAGLPKISIGRQPRNTAVVTNSPATFTVVATVQNGNPPPMLQYQWQRSGTNISGATNSSYTLPTPTLNDNSAQFQVVLSATGAATVTSSIATLTVATDTRVAFWKFDAGNPTADSSGNGNTLTLNGNITFSNDFPTNAPGSTNSAAFDGASYAQTVGTLDLTPYDQLTIEFFAKYSSGSPLQMFYAQNNANNVNGAFYCDTGEAGPTEVKVSQRTTGTLFETAVAPEPTDGAWHHYAVTMDESGSSSVFRIYVDGYEVDTDGQAGGTYPFIMDYFTIGGFAPAYNFEYQGLMGEMRVTFGILTPAQFIIGAGLPKIFISQQPQNTGVVTNNPATFTVVATVKNGTQQLQYQWQRNGVNISGASSSSYTLLTPTPNDNSAQFDVVVSATGAATVTSSTATLTVVTNAAIAYWKFDSANPTADSSGNGNTLALNGNIAFSSDVPANAPGSANSAAFDGASYAQTVGTLDLTPYDQITIEFFAKYSSGSPLQMFYAVNNVNNVQGAFYLDTGEAGPNRLKVSQRIAGSGFVTESAPEPTDGTWHHYALTMDESGASSIFKIYVDGNEVDRNWVLGPIQPFINDYFTIGGFPPTYDFEYNGLMDELRVSTGILTPDQFLTGPAILQISVGKGNAVISWPQNAGTFTLQHAGSLRGAWTTVTNSPVILGLNWQVTVPTAPTGMFYRLIR